MEKEKKIRKEADLQKLISGIQPKYYWLVAFALASLAMFLMLSYSQMLTSGKYVILGGDAWEIYIANIRMLIRNLTHGETIWYSFTTSMGYNTALTVAFELMSPFNLLFLIFQWADPNVILAIIIIAKVGSSAATFQLFASKVLNNKGTGSIVFAVFYAMCAFTVEYCIANFMWLDGLYMLPVVAWATYEAVKKNKYIFLTVSYAYIFIVQFYMGYLLAGFSLLYFVLLLCTQKKEERSTNPAESIGRYIGTVLISIALSAFLWVPVLTFLRTHTVSDATQFSQIGISFLDVLNNLFWGEFQDYHTYPYIYCGIPALLLLPFYFTNKQISGRERIRSGILLLIFALGCVVLPLYMLFHAFDAPDMWNFRFSFIISFLLCAIGCREIEYIKEIGRKWLVLLLIGLTIFYCVEQRLQPYEVGWVARNSNTGLLINFVLVLAWAGVAIFFLKTKKNKTLAVLTALALALVEVITNGCVRTFDNTWKEGLTREDYYYTWEREEKRNLQEIAELNGSSGLDLTPEDDFYRVLVYNDAIHNSDAYFGYNGITDFNSAENEALRDFMSNMGFYSTTRRTGGTGVTPAMEMILSVKNKARLYVDTAMHGLSVDTKIYENSHYLPVGYMVNEDVLTNIDYSGNVFENQNALIKAMTGVEGVYEKIPAEKIDVTDNGLIFLKEDMTFYRTNPAGGEVLFSVSDEPGVVYLQAEPVDGGDPGLTWGTFMNQANRLDYKTAVPFAVETIQSGSFHTASVSAGEGFSGIYQIGNLHCYTVSEEALNEAYEILSDDVLVVDSWKSGYLKGRIQTSGDQQVLFTSIPYTDGWTAWVNGTEVKIEPVCNGAFCGISIPFEGVFEVELKYTCPGAGRGVLISVVGLVLFVAALLSGRKVKDAVEVIENAEDNGEEKAGKKSEENA